MTDPLQEVRAFDRRHPLGWDLGLAVVIALVSLNAGAASTPVGWMVFAVVHAAVALRRRHALLGLLVAGSGAVAAAADALLTGAAPPWMLLAVWALLFNTALRARSRRTVLIAGGAALLVAVCTLVAPPIRGPVTAREQAVLALAVAGTAAAAMLLGLLVRGGRQRRAAEQIEIARAAAVAERSRIAQEMHDVIGHNLSVIVSLATGGGASVRASPDDAERALVAIGDVGRSSVREVRRVLRVLRHDASADGAPLSPQPGLDDLDALLDSVRDAGLPATLRLSGDLDELDAGRQLALYRIVQESLTNALRHAGPGAHADVTIAREPRAVDVTVVDDGRGAADSGAGYGLVGMRERAEAYGGELAAGPAGTGWRVRARIPVDDPEPQQEGTS